MSFKVDIEADFIDELLNSMEILKQEKVAILYEIKES